MGIVYGFREFNVKLQQKKICLLVKVFRFYRASGLEWLGDKRVLEGSESARDPFVSAFFMDMSVSFYEFLNIVFTGKLGSKLYLVLAWEQFRRMIRFQEIRRRYTDKLS